MRVGPKRKSLDDTLHNLRVMHFLAMKRSAAILLALGLFAAFAAADEKEVDQDAPEVRAM